MKTLSLAVFYLLFCFGCSSQVTRIENNSSEVANSVENIKPDGASHTSHHQENLVINNVNVTIHNFCTPMLDECESWIVLSKDNFSIKEAVNSPFGQLSTNKISRHGRYIAVESSTGGNCTDCSGLRVFDTENNKIKSLGYFSGIEGNYLFYLYGVFENNEFTSNALSPTWFIYYNVFDGNVSLDSQKTCHDSNNSNEYRNKKNTLSKILYDHRNDKQLNDSDAQEFYGSILYSLGFSKWCGLEEDYQKIASSIKNSEIIDLNVDKLKKLNDELNKVIPKDDRERTTD